MAGAEAPWREIVRGLQRRLAAVRAQSLYGALRTGAIAAELRELVGETRALFDQHRARLDGEGREQFTALLDDLSRLMYRQPWRG